MRSLIILLALCTAVHAADKPKKSPTQDRWQQIRDARAKEKQAKEAKAAREMAFQLELLKRQHEYQLQLSKQAAQQAAQDDRHRTPLTTFDIDAIKKDFTDRQRPVYRFQPNSEGGGLLFGPDNNPWSIQRNGGGWSIFR